MNIGNNGTCGNLEKRREAFRYQVKLLSRREVSKGETDQDRY